MECEYIGCTNKKAVNSNEGANTDDGSRQFKVTFRVDMWTTNCATRISADLTSDAGLSMEWANDSLYKYTAALHAGMHTFHYRMEDGTAEGLSHEISLDTSLLLNVVFFNSWEARTG